MKTPSNLQKKIKDRKDANSIRNLSIRRGLVDFSSNDYLGLASSEELFLKTHDFLLKNKLLQNGATGSRLLTGNFSLYNDIEQQLATIHNTETALLFTSGYAANLGVFSSIPQRGDIILYDEFIHASIRDGIQLSNAKGYKFKHNDLEHLQKRILKLQEDKEISQGTIYVVTESVFSMDGDMPDLKKMTKICVDNDVYLIVDEAHALGVCGRTGLGMVQELGLEKKVFLSIVTFGKALGCHGAMVLGSEEVIHYLVNFARSFIYTTGLSPHTVATIKMGYTYLLEEKGQENIQILQKKIVYFTQEVKRLKLNFIPSSTAIQCCIVPGVAKVKSITKAIQELGFDVLPILSPTVPKGSERLRFCLHTYNTNEEITAVLRKLALFVAK